MPALLSPELGTPVSNTAPQMSWGLKCTVKISESETEIRHLVLIGLEPVPRALLFMPRFFHVFHSLLP